MKCDIISTFNLATTPATPSQVPSLPTPQYSQILLCPYNAIFPASPVSLIVLYNGSNFISVPLCNLSGLAGGQESMFHG